MVVGVGTIGPAVGSLDAGVGTMWLLELAHFGTAAGSLDARVGIVATRVGTEPLSVGTLLDVMMRS